MDQSVVGTTTNQSAVPPIMHKRPAFAARRARVFMRPTFYWAAYIDDNRQNQSKCTVVCYSTSSNFANHLLLKMTCFSDVFCENHTMFTFIQTIQENRLCLRYQYTSKLTIFLKKCFWLFQIDLFDIFNLKKVLRIKIDSKQRYQRKTSLSINYL